MAAAGLAAVSPTQVIGLGEHYVWAFVIELAGLGNQSGIGIGLRRGHALLSPM
jgi:hypothetical protein